MDFDGDAAANDRTVVVDLVEVLADQWRLCRQSKKEEDQRGQGGDLGSWVG